MPKVRDLGTFCDVIYERLSPTITRRGPGGGCAGGSLDVIVNDVGRIPGESGGLGLSSQ